MSGVVNTLTLKSGRVARISLVRQYGTYEGLLCGFRDAEMTARRTSELIEEGRKIYPGEAYLVAPEIARRVVSRHAELRIEERLPQVACLAVWKSGELPGSDHAYSALLVAWFQESFGDIDPAVLDEVAAIDWERHAMGWDP